MSLDWAKAVDKILKDGEEKNAPAPSVAAAVPAAAASIGQQVPVVAALPPVHHIVVQPGDNLHSIAQQQLGNAAQWSQIAALNQVRNPNPNLIDAGQQLTLPGAVASPSDTISQYMARSAPQQPVLPPVSVDPSLQHYWDQINKATYG